MNDNAAPVCRRFLVSGRVQGVFYRASTQAQAQHLKLTGWARNLPDGSVEVVAAGSDEAVAELARWLWQGSPAANVESVQVSLFEGTPGDSFDTG